MGKPKFRPALVRYLEERGYTIEVDSRDTKRCAALYIDVNSIIHTAIRILPSGIPRTAALAPPDYPQAANQAIDCLIMVIQYHAPSQLVYLAVDGVAPMAKVKQQKERRYASAMHMPPTGAYDSNIVSPGTDFMFYLDKEINKRIVQEKDQYGVQKMYYSSHMAYGEGEHKIMKHIRENETVDGTSVIYGNDADLILLGLALNIKGVYVSSDTVKLRTRDAHIPETGYRKPLSIDLLRESLDEVINGHVDSFIYTMSLLGDDFTPKTPIMSQIDESFSLIMEYLKVSGPVTGYDELFGLVEYIAEGETFDVGDAPSLHSLWKAHLALTPNKDGYIAYQSPIFEAMAGANSDDAFRALWYKKCLGEIPLIPESAPDVFTMCVEYIRCLEWVFRYYTLGQDSVSWLWMYPYSHAPLLADVAVVLKARSSIKGFKESMNVRPNKDEIRFTSLHQLVAIMPVQSYQYVPEDLLRFYSLSGGLLHIMPSAGITVDYEFTVDEHQARPIVPPPNYTEIVHALANVKIRTKVVRQHLPVRDVSNIRPLPSRNRLAPRLYDVYGAQPIREQRDTPATRSIAPRPVVSYNRSGPPSAPPRSGPPSAPPRSGVAPRKAPPSGRTAPPRGGAARGGRGGTPSRGGGRGGGRGAPRGPPATKY